MLLNIVVLGFRIKANCPLVGAGFVKKAPSMGVFLRDPSPYLREFGRKPRKTPNDKINKRDRGLSLAYPYKGKLVLA